MVYFEIYLESFGNFIVGVIWRCGFYFYFRFVIERVVCMLCGFI